MRMAAGLSLHDLSVQVHYSRGHLSKVENSVAVPSPALVRLADAAVHASGQLIAFLEMHVDSGQSPGGTGDQTWTTVMDPGSGTWFSSAEPGQPVIQTAVSGFGIPPVSKVSPAQAEQLLQTYRASFDQFRTAARQVDPRLLLPTLWAATHALRQLAGAMEPIFINFRTGDQEMAAPFLCAHLLSRFGEGTVFYSSGSIRIGDNFSAALREHAEGLQLLASDCT